MKEITVTKLLDRDGHPICLVPLTNSKKTVTVFQDDFNYLIENGLSPLWRLENNQILERGTKLSVTRLVGKAGKAQKVHVLDGDATNLHRHNLAISSGGSGKNTTETLKSQRPHQFNKVTIKYEIINPPWHQ